MIRDVEKAIFAANLGLTPQKISENVLKCLVPRYVSLIIFLYITNPLFLDQLQTQRAS